MSRRLTLREGAVGAVSGAATAGHSTTRARAALLARTSDDALMTAHRPGMSKGCRFWSVLAGPRMLRDLGGGAVSFACGACVAVRKPTAL